MVCHCGFAGSLPQVPQWFAHCSSMVCQWIVSGLPMVHPTSARCLRAVRPWSAHGQRMTCAWFYKWSATNRPIACLWSAHNPPRGCAWPICLWSTNGFYSWSCRRPAHGFANVNLHLGSSLSLQLSYDQNLSIFCWRDLQITTTLSVRNNQPAENKYSKNFSQIHTF